MTIAKHTPGPLFVRQPEDKSRQFPIQIVNAAGGVVHEERRIAYSSDMQSVADVLDGVGWPHKHGQRDEIAEANQRQVADAYLRAAAPEMLEALEDALRQIEYLHQKFQVTGSGNAVIARINAAIAKAHGEG